MTHDPRSQPHAAAITQLEWFNLSTYAARTFVALCGLGSGTAKEVSEIAEVPRTRVYDAVDELHDRGLVEVRESSPQQFLAVSEETIGRKLESDTTHRLSVLTTALSQIEPADRGVEQRGIWTVDSVAVIRDRLLEFVAEADEEIVYLAADRFYSTALLDSLSTAADRGVSITVGGCSENRLAELRTAIPTVTDRQTEEIPSPVGRLLIVDGVKTLVSVQQENPDPESETAVWGVGETNSLVVILKSMFGLDAEPTAADD